MSAVLQVALGLASLAIVVLVACLVPMIFQFRRRLELLAVASDDMAHVARTLRRWSDQVDPLVGEVGSAIIPPVYTWVRNVNLLRTGAATFLQSFLGTPRSPQTTRKENDHV